MGIIKAVTQAVGGAFADQWLEVIEADNMGDQTVFTKGTLIRRGENKKGTDNVVSNGSMIHVYDNQFMMLVDFVPLLRQEDIQLGIVHHLLSFVRMQQEQHFVFQLLSVPTPERHWIRKLRFFVLWKRSIHSPFVC